MDTRASIFALLLSTSTAFAATPPSTPWQAPAVPDNWSKSQTERMAAKDQYLKHNQVGYSWFADFPFSRTDGIPYMALRLMPVIAPEFWGSEDNFLSVVGLFNDPRMGNNTPMPRGVGFSGMSRDDLNGKMDYASFTCGACHIGRMKKQDGSYYYLDAGINYEFNLVAFRVRVMQTLNKIYAGETGKLKRLSKAKKAFTTALDKMHAQDPNFFYRNWRFAGRNFDTDYEANQVKLFREKVNSTFSLTMPAYLLRSRLELEGFQALVNLNYKGYDEEMVTGLPGMADATGIALTNAWLIEKVISMGRKDPDLSLPPTPGLTDFMAPWEQNKRRVRWNRDKTKLVHGGGQWNGNIPIPMDRNLAAQSTLGLIDNDLLVSALSVDFLNDVPASVYPFDVDTELANKGRDLYQANCAGCHQPHNGTVYGNLGTSMSRAYVVDTRIAESSRSNKQRQCDTDKEVSIGGKTWKPCADFDDVSLKGKEQLAMRPVRDQHGYNALPLGGIWAQAPYLHNGSVPTLYHLLVPSERPTTFMKSRLEYDTKLVGFAWTQAKDTATDSGKETTGWRYDTTAFHTLNNRGHDRDIRENNQTYKLNWEDDIDGAWAIIEYMKTL